MRDAPAWGPALATPGSVNAGSVVQPRERPGAKVGRYPAPGRMRADGHRREVVPATDLWRPRGRAYGGSEGCS